MKTLFGLAICVALAICTVWLLVETPKPALTQDETNVRLRCEAQHGLLAVSRNDDGAWAECYQGKKRIWSVML